MQPPPIKINQNKDISEKLRYPFFNKTSIRKKRYTKSGAEFLKCVYQANMLLIQFKCVLLTKIMCTS